MVEPADKQDQPWLNAYVRQVLLVQHAVYVGFLSFSIRYELEWIIQVIPVRYHHVETEAVVLHYWQTQVRIGQHIAAFVHWVFMDNIVIQVRERKPSFDWKYRIDMIDSSRN